MSWFYQPFFTFVEVSDENYIVCSEKKPTLIQWGPRLPAGVHSLEMRNKKDLACKSSHPWISKWAVSPFAVPCMSSAGLHSLHLSVFSSSSNSCRFFSHFTMSCFLKTLQEQYLELRREVLCWASVDRCARPDAVCPWDLLDSCCEPAAVVWLCGVSWKGFHYNI